MHVTSPASALPSPSLESSQRPCAISADLSALTRSPTPSTHAASQAAGGHLRGGGGGGAGAVAASGRGRACGLGGARDRAAPEAGRDGGRDGVWQRGRAQRRVRAAGAPPGAPPREFGRVQGLGTGVYRDSGRDNVWQRGRAQRRVRLAGAPTKGPGLGRWKGAGARRDCWVASGSAAAISAAVGLLACPGRSEIGVSGPHDWTLLPSAPSRSVACTWCRSLFGRQAEQGIPCLTGNCGPGMGPGCDGRRAPSTTGPARRAGYGGHRCGAPGRHAAPPAGAVPGAGGAAAAQRRRAERRRGGRHAVRQRGDRRAVQGGQRAAGRPAPQCPPARHARAVRRPAPRTAADCAAW